MPRTVTNAPRYHLTHEQLAAGIVRADRAMTRVSRAAARVILIATVAAIVAIVVCILSPADAAPIVEEAPASDMLSVAFFVIAFCAFVAVMMSRLRPEITDEPIDYRDAESRGDLDV